MSNDWVPIWQRVKVSRAEAEGWWDRFLPTQRLYDSYHNEWDLMVLLDVDAEAPDHDYDDDDEMLIDTLPTILPNENVAYLGQINVAPAGNPYSSVQNLSS